MNKAQKELKDYLKEEKITKETLEQKIYPCFKMQMGYDRAEKLVLRDSRKTYSRYIEKKLLIQYYYDEERLEKAICLLTAVCDSKEFEWGILFHHEGIVLINSQIPKDKAAYKANKIVFRFAYGMERRQLRMLCWDDFNLNSVGKESIKIEEKCFPLPSILAEKLIELKRIANADERYVLGNCYTRNVRPLSGDGINSILSSITDREEFQNSYHTITVANVRRWLFKYLISEKYNIVAVMQMMNVSVQNLYNYVSKEQFIDFSRGDVKGIEEMSEHPMEVFIKDIFME